MHPEQVVGSSWAGSEGAEPGGSVPVCPRCGGVRFQRWGRLGGRTRYRCVACARTFTSQTGLPRAYLKHPQRWDGLRTCLEQRLSIRRSAVRLGVHPSTAFRWRHRWLDHLRRQLRPPFGGVVEVVDTYLSESAKGQRCLARPPRRHAVPHLSFDEAERIWVVLVCDRRGLSLAARLDWEAAYDPRPPRQTPRAGMLEAVLLPRLSPGSMVHSERRPWYRGFCRHHGLPYREVCDLARAYFTEAERQRIAESTAMRLGHHVNNAGALRRRLKPWLIPLRGVATRYLDNYLAWFNDRSLGG